ncbi:MAG TPA: PE-PPE domain-containing protein [Mycobacterium sp.]|nr:PE-PPE domain-containing protein [Mycobacterium sp.]
MAAAALLSVTAASSAHAETTLIVGPAGGGVPGLQYPPTSEIGRGWSGPGTAVGYEQFFGLAPIAPGSVSVNTGVADGVRHLNAAINNAEAAGGGPVTVVALSEGTLVVDAEQSYLANDPDAPPADSLTFIEFSNPQRGLAQTYLPVGSYVPFIDYTVRATPDSQYNTIVVEGQYDLFGNPPDRPWNILADLNALAGGIYVHSQVSLSSMSQAVEISRTTDSKGGTTTTYLVPTQELPLLQLLTQIGVPAWITTPLNKILKPIVDAGYSSLTPNDGPYFKNGRLVWGSNATPALPTIRWPSRVSAPATRPTVRTPQKVNVAFTRLAGTVKPVIPKPLTAAHAAAAVRRDSLERGRPTAGSGRNRQSFC